jgi:uncharacterized membrane protein
MKMLKNKYLVIVLLCLVALVNAVYLSYEAYQYMYAGVEVSSVCDLSQSISCTEVLKSPYSRVFGIPFPWIALVVYPILLALAYMGYRTKNILYAKVIQVLVFCGMLFNFFIIYREIFYIYAYCILCLICTLIIVSIFVVSTLIIRKA